MQEGVQISGFWLMLGALGVYAIFYRYYSAFLAAKVAVLDDRRTTPSHRLNDGQNYHPTRRLVLWGHHFAAISGAGPLIGPVLAAQFGYLPGFLWLVFGVCLGGAVQDFMVLVASMRRNGRSLAEIAREEISPVSGGVAMLAIMFIVIVALAVLGLVVVKALAESPWGTFAIGASIPIALAMGIYMYRLRKGAVGEASAIGVTLLLLAVAVGPWVVGEPGHPTAMGRLLTLDHNSITTSMAIYGFIASVLPVWLLLCPRDYLSSYMKVGTIALIVLAILLLNPTIQAPAFSQWVQGGGPIVKGPLFPFVFITIACGAISGFHALVSSGTSPKMIDRETDARPIGYGAMVMESLVGVTALIAASALYPADYFKINLKPEDFAALKMSEVHLGELSHLVQENLTGRTGGAVSLAAGITYIFKGHPAFLGLMKYLYHFVILFEALFVLTTIDTGTRIARFLAQEVAGRLPKARALGSDSAAWGAVALVFGGAVVALLPALAGLAGGSPALRWIGIAAALAGVALLCLHPEVGRPGWLPGTLVASFVVVAGWSYFIYTGTIQTLWPMFGVANQLLAVVALTVVTTVLINEGRARYAWVSLLPIAFVGTTTITAGVLSIRDIFLPMTQKADEALRLQGYVNSTLTAIMLGCVVIILIDAVPRWLKYRATGRAETRKLLEMAAATEGT